MPITDRWGDKHYVRRADFEHGKRRLTVYCSTGRSIRSWAESLGHTRTDTVIDRSNIIGTKEHEEAETAWLQIMNEHGMSPEAATGECGLQS